MNVEEIFSQLEGKITLEEFQQRIKEKIDEFSGLLSEEGAALIVATDLGVDLRLERPREFLQIKDLAVGMGNIYLCARITCISSVKTFQRDSGTGKVLNIEVMDKTGSTRVVLWDDLTESYSLLNKGDIVEIREGFVKKGFREGVEIHLSPSRRGSITKKPETDKELPECKVEYTPIGNLEEEMAAVDVVGRVGQLYGIREFQRNGRSGKVASLSLVDDTGEIRVCLWNEKADIASQLKRGDIIAVEEGSTKIGLTGLELHSGWKGRIIVNPGVEMKELPEVERVNLIDVEEGKSCNVSGMVISVEEKRFFVKSDGSPGQLASFTLQDETAEIRVVLWNEKADLIDGLVKGISVTIDNGFIKGGMAGLELHVSSVGQVTIEEWFSLEQKVFNLKKGAVDIKGRYYDRQLIDESGRVKIETDERIEDGQLIRVKGVYDGVISPEVIERIDEEFPLLDFLLHPPRKTIAEVKEGDFSEVYAMVKKVLQLDTYFRATIDDGSGEVTGIVFSQIEEGEEYCFNARIYKRAKGVEFVCYQCRAAEAEKEAFNVIRELEGLMEV